MLDIQIDNGAADFQTGDLETVQTGGQDGVREVDRLGPGVDRQAQGRLKHQEDRSRRPGLRQTGDRIGDGRLARLTREAAEQFGQPQVEVGGRSVDLGQDLRDRIALAVSRHAGGGHGGVVRPNRPVVIAHRIEAGLSDLQRADAPAGAELGGQQAFGDASRTFQRRQAGEQQVSGVGGDGATLLPVAIEGHGVEALVLHPELFLDQRADLFGAHTPFGRAVVVQTLT